MSNHGSCCAKRFDVTFIRHCRDYGSATLNPCAITGNPDPSVIIAGGTLPPTNCACTPTQCAAVNTANFTTSFAPSGDQGNSTVSGSLSPYPFTGMTNQTCFTTNNSGLGTASDTYRVGLQYLKNDSAYGHQSKPKSVCMHKIAAVCWNRPWYACNAGIEDTAARPKLSHHDNAFSNLVS